MTHRSYTLATTLLLGLTLTACQSRTPIATPQADTPQPAQLAAAKLKAKKAVKKEQAKKKPDFRYSPFVLKQPGHNTFERISFKDVGVRNMTRDDALYETVAESLAQELASSDLKWSHRVTYDRTNLDPNNHVACGFKSLYVDFWRSESPDRWGFSLWSGCGEDDNFAWKEVSMPVNAKEDLTVQVTPLTRAIAKTIRSADVRGCYQKTC